MGYNVIVPVIDNGNDNILLGFPVKSRNFFLSKADLCHSLLSSQSRGNQIGGYDPFRVRV
jgi:hypothetical protein